MNDELKTKEQLIGELAALREEVSRLSAGEESKGSIRRGLKKNVELFRALFRQASDCVLLMEVPGDGDPVIIDANAAACTMHGYDKSELIGKPIRILDAPDTARQVKERAGRLMNGETLFFEGEHVRKDGQVFPVEVSAQMIKVGGKSYIMAIDRDITGRKQAERELKDSARKLRESNQKLEGFAYLASYELQTPLLALSKAMALLEKKSLHLLDDEGRDHLETAKQSTQKTLQALREMLNLSTTASQKE